MTERSDAYRLGRRARRQGKTREDNPYLRRDKPPGTSLLECTAMALRWADGWIDMDWLMQIEKEKGQSDEATETRNET